MRENSKLDPSLSHSLTPSLTGLKATHGVLTPPVLCLVTDRTACLGRPLEGVVAEATYLGAFSRFLVAIGDTVLTVVSQNLEVGYDQVKALTEQRVRLSWDQDSCRPLAGAEKPAPATAGVTK